MTDTLARPEGRPVPATSARTNADSLAERLLETQSPQRPQSTPQSARVPDWPGK